MSNLRQFNQVIYDLQRGVRDPQYLSTVEKTIKSLGEEAAPVLYKYVRGDILNPVELREVKEYANHVVSTCYSLR